MTRVIIYNRVSTDEQVDGVSLDSQNRLNNDFCQQHNLEVVATFYEDYTGTVLQRPELDKARAMLRQGEAEGLICWKSGRLARKSSVSMLLREEFIENGSRLWYSSKGEVNLNDIAAMLIEDVEARMNEHWLKELLATMNSAKIEMIRQGSVMLHGQKIYGYNRYKDETAKIWVLEPIEDEAKVVTQMYHWYTIEGESIRGLIDRLEEIGAKPPRGKRGWSRGTVARILRTETYAGVWHWKPGTDEHIAVKVPAIISRELWEKTQARLAENKDSNRCKPKHKALLRGHISCWHCKYTGIVMSTNSYYKGKRSTYLYYGCPQCKDRAVGRYLLRKCEVKPKVSVPKLDERVWDVIVNVLLDQTELERGYRKRREAQQEKNAGIQTEIELVELAIAKREAELEEAIEMALQIKGKRTQALLQNKVDTLERDIDQLEQRKAELTKKLDTQGITQAQFETLQAYAAAIKSKIGFATFERKREIIELLGIHLSLKKIGDQLRFSLDSELGNLVEDEEVFCTSRPQLTNYDLERRSSSPPPGQGLTSRRVSWGNQSHHRSSVKYAYRCFLFHYEGLL